MPFTVLDKCWWLPHYLPSICQGQGEYIGGFMVKNAAAWNPGSWAGKSWGKNLCKGRKNPRTKGSEPPKAHGSSEPSARHLRLQIRTASTTWKALVVEKTCCFSSRRFRILVKTLWIGIGSGPTSRCREGWERRQLRWKERMLNRLMMSWLYMLLYQKQWGCVVVLKAIMFSEVVENETIWVSIQPIIECDTYVHTSMHPLVNPCMHVHVRTCARTHMRRRKH